MYFICLPPFAAVHAASRAAGAQIDTPPENSLSLSMLPDVNLQIEKVYRSDWGRIVAALIRLYRDFELAEDVAQEAFAAAVDQWRLEGIPENPRAWIIQAARNKAVDRIRRRITFAE